MSYDAVTTSSSAPDSRTRVTVGLEVREFERFRTWATQVLGGQWLDVRADDTGFVHHAELSVHGSVIFVGSTTSEDAVSSRMVIYLPGCSRAEVDAAAAASLAYGSEPACPPVEAPYGVYETWLKDPEGFTWVLCDYDPLPSDITSA